MTIEPAAPPRRPFHVMVKPTGPVCNLGCEYCYFLSKQALYPGDRFRMSEGLVESYLGQLLDSQPDGEVTVAWQGGEPTLMGVDFFRRAVELAEGLRRPGQGLQHTLQTNGTLLDDAWAQFFAEHRFLVGLSLDGPPRVNDTYRVDKHGEPTSAKVLRGLDALRRHDVDVNVLCTVHRANQDRALEVYRYFRDDLALRHVQFIPIVERDGDGVTDRSVVPEAWGRFLVEVFDEWLARDVGRVFVEMFEVALASWTGLPAAMCAFAEHCGDAVALDHRGNLYSCDHFVDPDHLLGNIATTPLADLVASPRQRRFGRDKADSLPGRCRSCEVRFACHGECPKNRFATTPDGEPGLNHLCVGYRAFFNHIDGPMRIMAGLLRACRPADEIVRIFSSAPRNAPCPCGSGAKAKWCHGRRASPPRRRPPAFPGSWA